MEIKDIRQFMAWRAAGPSTYPKRKAIFEEWTGGLCLPYFSAVLPRKYTSASTLPACCFPASISYSYLPRRTLPCFIHRYPSCSVTVKWFFSYRISPSRCMRDSSLLSALRSTFR